MNDALYLTFSQPQSGSYLPAFAGSRLQYGNGIFSTIARFAFPILKSLGQRLLGAAVRGGTSYLSGEKKFVPAMVDELTDEAGNLVNEGINKIRKRKASNQQGENNLISRKRQKANF